MKSLWNDADAAAAVQRYASQGVGEDLALRVYTTRLLGGDRRLVLHGGGNTSVKTRMRDVLGEEIDVLCVKGSGWDMATIEPAGLPAVRLEPLRRLVELDTLSDEAMVNAQRLNLLDAGAPNPSVETLLHAALPHTFIDHTHANAVLAISDQPDGDELCRDVFGPQVLVLPYIMPGFILARATHQAFQRQPDCAAIVLGRHGIFTFGPTARQSYELMIEMVTRAEDRLARDRRPLAAGAALPDDLAPPSRVAPLLRGRICQRGGLAGGRDRRFVLEHRRSDRILAYAGGADVGRYSQEGVVTPDHTIRVKPAPLLLPPPRSGDLNGFAAAVEQAVERFVASYRAYFDRNNGRCGGDRIPMDPMPRVLLVPGVGLFAAGANARAARVAADVAEANIEVITDAEAVGRYQTIDEQEIFDIEYWSLEQAKLGKAAEPPLARHVVAVTGGAGTIGRAIAAAFGAAGAEVALLDREGAATDEAAASAGGLAVTCDVTDRDQVQAAFDRICAVYGGVDIVVSNAGAAWQGRIGEVSDDVLRESFELNFFAHQHVARAAVAVMLAQGTGGALLFNVSKQAVNPGRDFGPYGLPKAATMALMRQYALDYGAEGIRSNAVNADRIRSGMLDEEMVASRARARGVSEAEYMAGNLLHREVTAEDVARAFVDLALAEKTTGAVLTVDGGNIAAALR